jgi:Predicted AAA-ATPase/PD-(D/E)XK nuclease superfamily
LSFKKDFNEKIKKMIRIPYGKSNFQGLISEGYFYQDRSTFIRKLENETSGLVFFLRPRRFGKSLFVSMLRYYYGLEHKGEFSEIFGKLAIGKKPTASANGYLVLPFEFSGIMTNTPQNTYEGFLGNVIDSVRLFLKDYKQFFTLEQRKEILGQDKPNRVLKKLFNFHKENEVPYPIYIMIDEYDHFANELISFNYAHFKEIVTENGFVRKFYEAMKTATWDNVVHRIFITGVSPITIDSMTSGFNIATNLSLDVNFHVMMGFSEKEVEAILKKIGVKKDNLDAVLSDLRVWYDGYLFSEDETNRTYNTDMVLYFSQYYRTYKKYPNNLLDNNIASDYSKVSNVFKIQNREFENFEALRILTETGQVSSQLTTQFSFVKTFSKDDLVSLLFYMGFLTIKKKELGALVFQFPNFVIQRLYADYFVSILQQFADLPIDNSDMNASIRLLATTGNLNPFMDQVGQILKMLSNRDAYHFNEMTLKAIFVSCLFQQQFYYVHSEYETDKGYADVFLEGIRGYDPNYQVAFELKYIKKKDKNEADKKITDDDIKKLLDKAEAQLTDYMITKKFIDRKGLLGFVVICHGDALIWQKHSGFPKV